MMQVTKNFFCNLYVFFVNFVKKSIIFVMRLIKNVHKS